MEPDELAGAWFVLLIILLALSAAFLSAFMTSDDWQSAIKIASRTDSSVLKTYLWIKTPAR